MTRKSPSRLKRDHQKIPKKENIAAIIVDKVNSKIFFTTNDMLLNQLHRDGPRVAKSFDSLAGDHLVVCSAIFGRVQGLLIRHLPRLEDNGFKATATRLLSNAANSYVASIELARHGYPRQYGAVARMFIEALATVIALAIKEGALDKFHSGTLDSAKCISLAKPVLPMIGQIWGLLSNSFVHIGKRHSVLEPPSVYTADDEALSFIITSMRGSALLLYIVADLIVSDENGAPGFWKREDQKVSFDPEPELSQWMAGFLGMIPSYGDQLDDPEPI